MTEPIRADLLESGELPEGWEREEEVRMVKPADRLDEWQRLADEATPGPWGEYLPNPIYGTYEVAEATKGYLGDAVARCGDVEAARNAAFIAASRVAVPALLDAVQAVLDLHQPEWGCGNPSHTNPSVGCPECFLACACGDDVYPCPTVRTITDALTTGDTND